MKSHLASDSSLHDLNLVIEEFIAAPDTTGRFHSLVNIVRAARKDGEGQRALVGHFIELLEVETALRDRFGVAMAQFLADTDATNFIGCAGIPGTRGFLAELSDRVFVHLLPTPRNQRDLTELFGQLYGTEADVERLRAHPLDLVHRIVKLFLTAPPEGSWRCVQAAFCDGFRLLLSRIRAEGLSSGLRARASQVPVTASPYYQLEKFGDELIGCWLAGEDLTESVASFKRISGECRKESRAVLAHLDATGVRVDVVFSLEVIDRCLTRTALMMDIMQIQEGPLRSKAIQRLLIRLVHFAARDRSLGDLISWNLHLLGHKIVDRTADTGEHYIAKNRREYWGIWVAAAGGGLLTVVTGINKATLHLWHLPPLPEGLLAGLNYSISFIVLQHLGLILATKQPAMTAAHFASIIRESEGEDREELIADNAARLVSSQLAAAFGNVLTVALGMVLVGWLWIVVTGAPFYQTDAALATLRDMSPFNSGTIFYAAMTGVVLWLASVFGGWFDNWCVCHRIAQGIAQRPVRTSHDKERWQRLARMVERNASGWGTNISLGFMLGFLPEIGRFVGVPLEVRHVTLNTGLISLAGISAFDNPATPHWLLLAGCGIVTMFVLNLSVSFACSLASAAKAYDLSGSEVWGLLRSIGLRLIRKPGQFFFGLRDNGSPMT